MSPKRRPRASGDLAPQYKGPRVREGDGVVEKMATTGDGNDRGMENTPHPVKLGQKLKQPEARNDQ
jgi:hypothetical protein